MFRVYGKDDGDKQASKINIYGKKRTDGNIQDSLDLSPFESTKVSHQTKNQVECFIQRC